MTTRKCHIKAMRKLRKILRENKIKTKVVAVARSGSCYIEPEDLRIGKIRIGNHAERLLYGYRWQLRSDIKEMYIERRKGHPQYFYPLEELDQIAYHIINYYKAIKRRNR